MENKVTAREARPQSMASLTHSVTRPHLSRSGVAAQATYRNVRSRSGIKQSCKMASAGLCNHKTGLGHPIPPPSPNHQKNMAGLQDQLYFSSVKNCCSFGEAVASCSINCFSRVLFCSTTLRVEERRLLLAL